MANISTSTITAIAKSEKTVISATEIPTKLSATGTQEISLKLHHSKVLMTTINITPTNTVIGVCSIY